MTLSSALFTSDKGTWETPPVQHAGSLDLVDLKCLLHNEAAEGAFADAVRLARAGDIEALDWLQVMAPDIDVNTDK